MSETTKAAPSSGASVATPAAAKTSVKNGKGSSPRNISKRFLKNYDGIKWSTGGKDRQEGRKVRKVYS